MALYPTDKDRVGATIGKSIVFTTFAMFGEYDIEELESGNGFQVSKSPSRPPKLGQPQPSLAVFPPQCTRQLATYGPILKSNFENLSRAQAGFGMLMFALYQLMLVILLVNLLIAMMSHTYDDVQDAALNEWLVERARLLLDYTDKIHNVAEVRRGCFRAATLAHTGLARCAARA